MSSCGEAVDGEIEPAVRQDVALDAGQHREAAEVVAAVERADFGAHAAAHACSSRPLAMASARL